MEANLNSRVNACVYVHWTLSLSHKQTRIQTSGRTAAFQESAAAAEMAKRDTGVTIPTRTVVKIMQNLSLLFSWPPHCLPPCHDNDILPCTETHCHSLKGSVHHCREVQKHCIKCTLSTDDCSIKEVSRN